VIAGSAAPMIGAAPDTRSAAPREPRALPMPFRRAAEPAP